MERLSPPLFYVHADQRAHCRPLVGLQHFLWVHQRSARETSCLRDASCPCILSGDWQRWVHYFVVKADSGCSYPQSRRERYSRSFMEIHGGPATLDRSADPRATSPADLLGLPKATAGLRSSGAGGNEIVGAFD